MVASPAVGSLPDPATPQLPSNNHRSSPAEGTLPDPVTLQLPSITHLTTPAVGNLPNPAMLQLPTINHLVESPIPQILPSLQEHQPVAIGEGLPPIPGKLVKKIESGLYIELGELLPDNLSVTNATGDIADAPKASKPVTRPTLSIIEWVQSFVYTAILSKSQPNRVADLLGYQTLILQAHQEFQGDFWLRYDRTFRQKAATLKNAKWDTIALRQPPVCFKWNRDVYMHFSQLQVLAQVLLLHNGSRSSQCFS